jgi:hypothetical protein
MEVLKGIQISFSFWNGIQDSAKRNLLRLTAETPSMDALAVFQPSPGEFSRMEDGMNPPPPPSSSLLAPLPVF